MRLAQQWNAAPAVVQRLAFVWCVFALFFVAVGLTNGIFLGQWDSLPTGTVFSVCLLTVGWGHVKRHKWAWLVGLLLSGLFLFVSLLFIVPRMIEGWKDFVVDPAWLQRHSPFYIALFEAQKRLVAINSCAIITGVLLMATALILALSPSGRAAYSIGRKRLP